MHDTLVAYIEGTLSAEERTAVRRRIQNSVTWQQELSHVEQVQNELASQMPLLGHCSARQLNALLPEILMQARQPKPRRHNWWKGMQILTMMTCVFGVLLMVPLIIQSAAANEQETWSPNVPRSTATPHNVFHNVVAAKETQEPKPAMRAAFYVHSSMSYTQQSPVHCEASPVPMPGSTLSPSRSH